jgi:hypothetical protein
MTKDDTVVPAKAGTHFDPRRNTQKWIPAFAGMTRLHNRRHGESRDRI